MHEDPICAAAARLLIADRAYTLQAAQGAAWAEVAALPGGARSLLPDTRAVDERGLEAAIEAAEDWLMPHAAGLRGAILEVSDPTGRLASGLREVLGVRAVAWSVAEVEGFFLRLIDLTTGRTPSPAVQGRQAFIADVLIVRELAHHGQVRQIRLG